MKTNSAYLTVNELKYYSKRVKDYNLECFGSLMIEQKGEGDRLLLGKRQIQSQRTIRKRRQKKK